MTIETGEMYNIRVKVFAVHKNIVTVTFVDGDDSGDGLVIPSRKLSILSPIIPNILVTPVENLEPYSVGGSIDGCVVYKNGEYYAEFVNSIEAEQVCKLLNAKHKKDNKQ